MPSYKRSGNFSILGLGDIVIPGLLLCFVLRFDAYKRNQIYQVIISSASSSSSDESTCTHSQSGTRAQQRSKSEEACNTEAGNKSQQPHKIECECCANCKFSHHVQDDVFAKATGGASRLKRYFSYPLLQSSDHSSLNRSLATRYSIRNLIRFNRMSYFHCSLIGYFLGLITATLSSEIFREAQPALLFLVPFTLLPLLIMAYIKVIFLIQIKLCFFQLLIIVIC